MDKAEDLRPVPGYSRPQFLDGKVLRLTYRDQFLFFYRDLFRHRRNLAGNVKGNGLDAVQIAVKQVAGLDFQSGDFNLAPHLHDVNISV